LPSGVYSLPRRECSVTVGACIQIGSEYAPMVVEKLICSDHDIFVDNAVRFLGRSKQNYSQLFLARYTEFRNPYVQSLLCIIFSIRGSKETIPWMMDRFYEMKILYLDEIIIRVCFWLCMSSKRASIQIDVRPPSSQAFDAYSEFADTNRISRANSLA
jgi:hypothetical protein